MYNYLQKNEDETVGDLRCDSLRLDLLLQTNCFMSETNFESRVIVASTDHHYEHIYLAKAEQPIQKLL